jgi:hypothetical protein
MLNVISLYQSLGSGKMDRLLFLLLSIVLTVFFIYVIPLGLAKKEKNLIAVSASLIGSLSLFAYSLASLWQVLLVMVLLATSVGYIIVNRFSSMNSPVPLINRLNDRSLQGKNYIQNSIDMSSLQEDEALHDEFDQPFIEVSSVTNVFPSEDVKEFDFLEEEDISFLEDRNRMKTPDLEIHSEKELTGINYDDMDYFEEQSWADEPEKQKVLAGTHT